MSSKYRKHWISQNDSFGCVMHVWKSIAGSSPTLESISGCSWVCRVRYRSVWLARLNVGNSGLEKFDTHVFKVVKLDTSNTGLMKSDAADTGRSEHDRRGDMRVVELDIGHS